MTRLLACFLTVSLFAAPALATGGKLVKTSGQVWLKPSGGQETRASVGDRVEPGMRIRTGVKGAAEVHFDDKSVLKVRPGSSLLLSGKKRAKKKKNSVLLFFGRVWSKVSKTVGADSTYEVNTANAVCGVRGTEFETAVADDGSVRVRVTEGVVAVDGDGADGSGEDKAVTAGQEVEADEEGVEPPATAEERAKWEAWEKRKKERLRTQGKKIVDGVKKGVMGRKERLENMRARQQELESKRKAAEKRARGGDSSAIKKIKECNMELADLADAIADLGDAADCQFEVVDHFADLASDPLFRMVNRKYIEAEAASLRRIKAMFDKMVAEGTDMSMEAMDDMLDDLSSGKTGTLKDDTGSTVDDLFGGDENDMDMDKF